MIKVVDISKSIIDLSRCKSEEMGLLNNSITSGEGNLAGFVGEYLVADLIGGKVSNTYDYDVVAKNGKTIDVKTKRTNYPPLDHYECSVAAYNTRQDCDYYFFVRVSNTYTIAWNCMNEVSCAVQWIDNPIVNVSLFIGSSFFGYKA